MIVRLTFRALPSILYMTYTTTSLLNMSPKQSLFQARTSDDNVRPFAAEDVENGENERGGIIRVVPAIRSGF